MPFRHTITQEQLEELKKARKQNKDKHVEYRLKALILHAEKTPREVIASKTDYEISYISSLVTKYLKNGLSAIVENNYTSHRRNLSLEEESNFMLPFIEDACQGKVVSVREIKKAYEEYTGKSLEKSHGQIYKVLSRQGWRIVMPRSKHPNKASEEEIEASKKNSKKKSKKK